MENGEKSFEEQTLEKAGKGTVGEKILEPTRTENNHTELFIDGPDTLAMLLREINNAQYFIHVQVMLFYSDDAGFKLAEALAAKAEEGVEVRVMSDSEMSTIVRALEKFRSSFRSNFSELKELFSKAGVKFVASDKESYSFGNWDEKRKELKEKGVPEEFLQMQDVVEKGIDTNINVFDHRKVIVFDGETAVITGANIGNKYLYEEIREKEPSAEKWHDGALLLKGPVVDVLNRQFSSKWMVTGGDIFDHKQHYRKKERYGNDICTVYSFFPGMEQNRIRDWYFRKLKDCKGRFLIENPYINDQQFWEKLSGLSEGQAKKIEIINPYGANGNDFPQNKSAIQCSMWEPFRRGVSFFAYQERMTHWKIALDEESSEVFMGSYNLNNRSAQHDFEMNVLVESENLSKQVLTMLEQDKKESTEITDESEFYESPNLHPSCQLLVVTSFYE